MNAPAGWFIPTRWCPCPGHSQLPPRRGPAGAATNWPWPYSQPASWHATSMHRENSATGRHRAGMLAVVTELADFKGPLLAGPLQRHVMHPNGQWSSRNGYTIQASSKQSHRRVARFWVPQSECERAEPQLSSPEPRPPWGSSEGIDRGPRPQDKKTVMEGNRWVGGWGGRISRITIKGLIIFPPLPPTLTRLCEQGEETTAVHRIQDQDSLFDA